MTSYQRPPRKKSFRTRETAKPVSGNRLIDGRIPARVHVILASAVPKAVILRRGPTNETCTIGWDLETDTFSQGQWLRGRIYEYKSDLSPDGKYFIYAASDFRRTNFLMQRQEEIRQQMFGACLPGDDRAMHDEQLAQVCSRYHSQLEELVQTGKANSSCWTAVSQAPYLKALDLWFCGTPQYGGGMFLDSGSLWLNGSCSEHGMQFNAKMEVPFSEKAVPNINPGVSGNIEGTIGVYCRRLIQSGWAKKRVMENACLYEKTLPFGWCLQKMVIRGRPDGAGTGICRERHRIVNMDRRLKVDGEAWRWADYDAPRKRILYVRNGILLSLRTAEDFASPIPLLNLNNMKFESVKAPY